MLSKIHSKQIYTGDYGWHTGRFHFSFADYKDPANTYFGDLLTFNDFTLLPSSGFTTHPHHEVEIVSYCVAGELSHVDNLGNRETICPGGIQYTCAGSGILHSEGNDSANQPLRFIQIWIRPNSPGLDPHYCATNFRPSEHCNRLLQVVSGEAIENVTRINQDANIYVTEIDTGQHVGLSQMPGRQLYLSCLEGKLQVNGIPLGRGDALKVWDECSLDMVSLKDCHLVLVDLCSRSGSTAD